MIHSQTPESEYLLDNTESLHREVLRVRQSILKKLWIDRYEDESPTSKEIIEESNYELLETKDKILSEISNNEEIKKGLIESLDLKSLSDEIKSKIIQQVKESILENTKKIVGEHLVKIIGIDQLKENLKENIDNKILPKIEEQLGLIKGFIMFNCPRCKKDKRISSARMNEEGIICGTCFVEDKDMKDSSWFKRDKKEKEKW